MYPISQQKEININDYSRLNENNWKNMSKVKRRAWKDGIMMNDWLWSHRNLQHYHSFECINQFSPKNKYEMN